RMGDTGDPCGIPFSTGAISPLSPSKHIATSLSDRKLATHLTYCSGSRFRLISASSRLWFTKSKYPLMSKVSADVPIPWFHAACTSLMNDSIASSAE
ncbi:hypothetical protein ARMGADRAFT_933313, partial [Armillaria gallica]